MSKSKCDTMPELMSEWEVSYFDTTSRFSKSYQTWCLDYHGFEITIQPSIGKNDMLMCIKDQRHFDCPSTRDAIRLQFQLTSKLDLLSTLSSSTSKAAPGWRPAPGRRPASPAKEHQILILTQPTQRRSSVDINDDGDSDAGVTDEEFSDVEIEYISLPKLKREIRRADLTGDQVYLCTYTGAPCLCASVCCSCLWGVSCMGKMGPFFNAMV